MAFQGVLVHTDCMNDLPSTQSLGEVAGKTTNPAILIVDDVMENVRLLKNLLQDIGRIVFAVDGFGALEQAQRHRPDIILLDVHMPGIDGYETCRRLKAAPETRDTPVLFITGADGEQDEARGLAQGAIDYITKPFSPDVVRVRVLNQLALMRAQAELRSANDAMRKFKAAVESSSNSIMITDRHARIEYVNLAFAGMSGYSAQEALGQTPALLKSDMMTDDTYAELWHTILRGENWRGELCNRRKDGSLFWQDVAIAPVFDCAGTITHFVGISSDITQRKKMEEELRSLAVTDALTGVGNRRHLIEVGERELARMRRSGEPLCVLMLDIDHFKRINDTHGHTAGDVVLKAFARVCTETLRSLDTIGRLGGEEFAVVLPMTDLHGALELAERVRARVAAYEVDWEHAAPIRFTVSIGVAQAMMTAADFAFLLGHADQALYVAKKSGRNRVVAAADAIRSM